MSLIQEHIEAIIVSLLAVNSYGVEKSYALLPNLRNMGLTDPTQVAKADTVDVMMRLDRSGYNRGMLSDMMADRLINLMKAVSNGELEDLTGLVSKGDEAGASELLCKVKGIGPRVAENVWMLAKQKSTLRQ
jgi:endonuclease III-like uncharacterized protein